MPQEGGRGWGELLVALPACHLDRGGPDERGREDGAAPGLVLLKTGGRGGGRKKGGETYFYLSSSSPFHLPVLRTRGGGDRKQQRRGAVATAEMEAVSNLRRRRASEDARLHSAYTSARLALCARAAHVARPCAQIPTAHTHLAPRTRAAMLPDGWSDGQTETCVLGSTLLCALVAGRLGQATPRELPRKHAAWKETQERRNILTWCTSSALNSRTSTNVELVVEEGTRGSVKGALPSGEQMEAHPCERPRTHAAAHPAW